MVMELLKIASTIDETSTYGAYLRPQEKNIFRFPENTIPFTKKLNNFRFQGKRCSVSQKNCKNSVICFFQRLHFFFSQYQQFDIREHFYPLKRSMLHTFLLFGHVPKTRSRSPNTVIKLQGSVTSPLKL